MRPKNSRNASGPGGGNNRARPLPKAHGRGWRTPAAAHSRQRRAAQSADGWQQLSSKLYMLMVRRASSPSRTGETPVAPSYDSLRSALLVTRDDRRLDIPVAVQHVAQHIVQARKRRFAGNVVGAANFLLGNQTEGPAHRLRRVMECRLQSDFGVVQAIGVQLHLSSRGATAEEIYRAALANHLNGPLPGFRAAYRFNR